MEQRTPTEAVAARVRELRERRGGMSAQALADRCAELGMPGLKRQAITNLENGRRGMVTVEELLVLAAALDVPPLDLLMSADGADLAVTPDLVVGPERLVLWFAGELPAVGLPTVGFGREATAVRSYRAAYDAHTAAKDADRNARFARKDGETEEAERFEQERERQLQTLAGLADSLIEAGLRPPTINPGWARMMIRRGWFRNPDRVPIEDGDDGEG